jgi:hypothetical protein
MDTADGMRVALGVVGDAAVGAAKVTGRSQIELRAAGTSSSPAQPEPTRLPGPQAPDPGLQEEQLLGSGA